MRPIALGRSNWIHIGSEHAGPRIAAIFSVVESCRRLNIPIRDYLADIFPGLANAPLQRIAELTPAAWAARHPHLSTVGFALTDTNNSQGTNGLVSVEIPEQASEGVDDETGTDET